MKRKLLALVLCLVPFVSGCQALKDLSTVGLNVSVVDGEAKAQVGPLRLDLDLTPEKQ